MKYMAREVAFGKLKALAEGAAIVRKSCRSAIVARMSAATSGAVTRRSCRYAVNFRMPSSVWLAKATPRFARVTSPIHRQHSLVHVLMKR